MCQIDSIQNVSKTHHLRIALIKNYFLKIFPSRSLPLLFNLSGDRDGVAVFESKVQSDLEKFQQSNSKDFLEKFEQKEIEGKFDLADLKK